MWHPSGDSSQVVGLADNHVIIWDIDTGASTAKVRLFCLCENMIGINILYFFQVNFYAFTLNELILAFTTIFKVYSVVMVIFAYFLY